MKFTALRSGYIITSIIASFVCIAIIVFSALFLIHNRLNIELFAFFSLINIVFIVSVIRFLWNLFFGIFSYTLYINERGVEYKINKNQYVLKWKDIQYIQVLPDTAFDRWNPKMICFNAGELQRKYIKAKYFHSLFFGALFSKGLIFEIEKYWDKPIQGIYHIMGPRENSQVKSLKQ